MCWRRGRGGWMKEITLASAAVVTSSDRRFPLKPGVPSFDALFVRWVCVPLAGVKAGTPVHRGLHNRALCSLYISKLKDDRQAHEQRDTQAGEKKERRTASVCQASEERDWDAAATNQQTLKRERGERERGISELLTSQLAKGFNLELCNPSPWKPSAKMTLN